MIHDSLKSAPLYHGLHPLFPQAFAYLQSFDPNTPDGKYELHGKDLVAIVERYSTKPAGDKEWEAHEVYGDIQAMIEGSERCGHCERSRLAVIRPYNPEKDVEKFSAPAHEASSLVMTPGMFAIFYPQDAHQPSVQMHAPAPVLKVVLKFRLHLK
jgi:YhcH/YjgK/YiaL family protein